MDNSAIVAGAKNDLLAHGEDLSGSDGAFKICVLAARRIQGGGVKQKTIGENSHGCSITSIMLKTPDENGNNDFEVLISPGTANQPEWRGFNIPGSVWVDPHRSDLPTWAWENTTAPPVTPPPTPTPPAPGSNDITAAIDALTAELHALRLDLRAIAAAVGVGLPS